MRSFCLKPKDWSLTSNQLVCFFHDNKLARDWVHSPQLGDVTLCELKASLEVAGDMTLSGKLANWEFNRWPKNFGKMQTIRGKWRRHRWKKSKKQNIINNIWILFYFYELLYLYDTKRSSSSSENIYLQVIAICIKDRVSTLQAHCDLRR